MIENPRTGEQIEFVVDTAGLLVMQSVRTRPGHRAVRHVHPGMEERFVVQEGRPRFLVGELTLEAGPGETVIVPPGVEHVGWNPTDGIVRLVIEMRPALRWREFTERLFSGEDAGELLCSYETEVQFAGS